MITTGTGRTDRGRKRQNNEDGIQVDDELGLYLVCDGMGGHAAGEVASAVAIEAATHHIAGSGELIRRIGAGSAPPEALLGLVEGALNAACAEVHQRAVAEPELAGMGCTMTALFVSGAKAAMGHAGDSRLYLLREGQLHQLSSDHTVAAELARAGLIREDQIPGHRMAHVLSRALGAQPATQVESLLLDLQPDDQLLLCTDGLSEYAGDGKPLVHLLADPDPENAADELIRFANDSGGRDNVSVVLVRVAAEGPVQPAHALATRDLDALAGVFLFEDLTLAHRARLLAACAVVDMKPGEPLVAAGDSLETLYVVVAGGLECDGQLTPGDCLGAEALLAPHPVARTIVAAGRTRVLALSREALLNLARARPLLGITLLERLGRWLSKRIGELEDR